jgi:hypothetical protein
MHRLVAILVLGSACGGPFAEARREGTSAAYGSFVANHPDHGKVPKAIELAEQADWASTTAADTSSAYAMYVVTHPTGPHVAEARARGEARQWAEAQVENTLVAYADYISAYPQGVHRQAADDASEDITAEEVRLNDSVEGWGRYLFRYPEGRYVEEARARRDALAWGAAQAANDRAAYEFYLSQNPNGEHRQESRDWLGSLAISTLQPVLVLGDTWRPVSQQRADRDRLAKALERTLLRDLKTRFEVRPLRVEDAVGGDRAHPADRHGREPGVGLLVVEVSQEVGDSFEPSGHATLLPTTVSIYAAPTDAPLWTYTFDARTPERLVGSFVESLYTEAVGDWEYRLSVAPVPVEPLSNPVIP